NNGVGSATPVANQPGLAPDGGTSVLFANNGGSALDAGTVQSNGVYAAGVGDGTYQLMSNNYSFTAWVTVDSAHTNDSDRIFVSSRYDAGTGWMAGVRNHGGVDNNLIVDFGNSRAYTGISLAEDTPYFVA